jgi:hypothetical protein
MRCLYCNKKLSLLKLAKGDSFCSPEHFDAHQLKLSKDAFERLMSVPEEAPKEPLVVQHPEPEPQVESLHDEKAAMARLSGFPHSAPPYAPFAISVLHSYSLNPQSSLANEPDSVEAARELAFPVHSVQGTVCILNLYLRLSLADSEPRDWTSSPHLVVTMEDFHVQIQKPPIGFMPEFPRIENLARVEDAAAAVVEEAAVAEAAPVLEQAPVVELAPVVEETAIVETAPAVEEIAAVEAAPVLEPAPAVEEIAVVEAASVSAPVVEEVRVAEEAPVVEAAPVVEDIAAVEEVPLAGPAPDISAVMPAETAPQKVNGHAVPFLTAPTFRPRAGEPIVVHDGTSAVQNGSALSPVLNRGNATRLDSCDAIPSSAKIARNPAFRLQDGTSQWINGSGEFPVDPAFVLPQAKEQVCGEAWQPSDRRMAIARPALEAVREPTRSVDFDLPKPSSLLERPGAARLAEVDPQQLLAGGTPLKTTALFLEVLETRPRGRDPFFADLRPYAVESSWKAVLAHFPRHEALPAAWRHRPSYFSLPDPIAAGTARPMVAQEALPYGPACTKTDATEWAGLPAPYRAQEFYRLTPWPQTDFAWAPFRAEMDLLLNGATMLPVAAKMPAGSLRRGRGDAALRWDPRAPAYQAPPAVKFLPVRDTAVLPAAKSWPRLESVPR